MQRPQGDGGRASGVFPLQTPRGTQDILPMDQKFWEYVLETASAVLRSWDFQRVDTPLFEETALFVRGVGEGTDIVAKELFELKARGGGAAYSLRPEGTAPLVRAYVQHGMRSWPKPVKLYYAGPFFRYDRPQAGRWRQFYQVGFEIFGSAAPVTDAEVMYLMHVILSQLGLEDYQFLVNSLGPPADRAAFLKVLKEHLRRNRARLCRDCKERLTTNPLRVLDCREEKCRQVANTAPRLLDYLSEEARSHFDRVLKMLEELAVPHTVQTSLVRGLDYYTGTVWEVFAKGHEAESQGALASGGRYDGLVKLLGGRETTALGGAAGIERLIERVKAEGIELTEVDRPRVFIAQLGEAAKLTALRAMRLLQEAQIPFSESLDRDGMQQQLKLAARLGATWVVIIGHKEVLDKTVILRNMVSGMQEVVPREELAAELARRLSMTE